MIILTGVTEPTLKETIYLEASGMSTVAKIRWQMSEQERQKFLLARQGA